MAMLKPLLDLIPRHLRFWALGLNLLILAAVVAASLLATPIYRSEALLVPKSAFSSSGAELGGSAQAALLGLGLGGAASKLSPFEAILKSPAVIDRFIATSGLREAVKKDYIEDYRDLVSNILLVDFRKDGSISIAFDDKSPTDALRYAQAYVDAFEGVAKGIAERSAKSQADALSGIVDHARSTYDTSFGRVKESRIDESLLRNDPQSVALALTELENKLLQSRIRLAQLDRTLANGNPELAAARAAHAELSATRERLLRAPVRTPEQAASASAFALDALLARQAAAFVGAYAQAREKLLVDAMTAASPYILAQAPTLPEKRIRPQRRRMISFSLMVQALVTVALLGVYASVRHARRRQATAHA